jgi:hypothetical protein
VDKYMTYPLCFFERGTQWIANFAEVFLNLMAYQYQTIVPGVMSMPSKWIVKVAGTRGLTITRTLARHTDLILDVAKTSIENLWRQYNDKFL